MRILQVCPRIPWPPHDGGRVAMLALTRSLRADVVALNQRKFHVDVHDAAAALAPSRLDVVDIDTSRVRAIRGPLLVSRFYSRAFERLLRERVRGYDVIQLEGQFLLPYVRAIREETRAPIVLRAQNVESLIWSRLAAQASGVRRIALSYVARTLRAWEAAHLDDCDALLPIAEEDEREFRTMGATRPSLVLPCGIDMSWSDGLSAGRIDPYSVYFIGSMRYRPNQEAARWLTDEVWPRVVALEPRARLTLAGSGQGNDIDDIRTFSAPFRAMLAPMFSGSGMRIKVLEAMALGKPVIATPLGAGGIDVTHAENILLGEDADAIARYVVDVMHDDALAKRIGDNARALVVERYDADVLARRVRELYTTLLRNAS